MENDNILNFNLKNYILAKPEFWNQFKKAVIKEENNYDYSLPFANRREISELIVNPQVTQTIGYLSTPPELDGFGYGELLFYFDIIHLIKYIPNSVTEQIDIDFIWTNSLWENVIKNPLYAERTPINQVFCFLYEEGILVTNGEEIIKAGFWQIKSALFSQNNSLTILTFFNNFQTDIIIGINDPIFYILIKDIVNNFSINGHPVKAGEI